MKYIRTTDGRILDTSDYRYSKKQHWFEERIDKIDHIGLHFFCWKDEYDKIPNCIGKLMIEQLDKNEVKQSDTIEELCDRFVYDEDVYFPKIVNGCLETYDYEANEIKVTKEMIKKGIYAAIWTDKGLIWVAKMKGILPNGDIDWELL